MRLPGFVKSMVRIQQLHLEGFSKLSTGYKLENFMNVEKQPKYCMQCNKNETLDNPIKSPLGPGWDICRQCLQRQAQIMLKFKQNRPRLYPQIQMITDGVYLGNEDAAIDEQIIKLYKISAICVCGSYLMTPFEGKQVEGNFKQIKYVRYEIADHYDQKIMHLFDENSDWIEQRLSQGRNVLVHCAAGVSRSASFVIAYLMKKKQMLYPDAIRHVKQRRPVISPNGGFKKQLQEYGLKLVQGKIGSKSEKNQKQQGQDNQSQSNKKD